MNKYSRRALEAQYLSAQRRMARIKARTLNQSHVEELVKRGSRENFMFLHHGRKVEVEREASVPALMNSIDTGAIGMRSNHEQNSRLLIQLEPINGIAFDRFNFGEEGWSSDDSNLVDNSGDFEQDSDSGE